MTRTGVSHTPAARQVIRRGLSLLATSAFLAAFGAGGFVLAGCGGGDDTSMTDTTGSTDTTSTEGTTGNTETTTSTEGPTGNTETNGTDGPTTARLSFELDLVGPVLFADRYSVNLSINGTEYVHGFCGFGDESTRCLATVLYAWELPSVPLGARLSWYFTRTSVSTLNFAQAQDVTFAQGTSIAAKCVYSGSTTNSEPTCERIS